MPAPLQHGSSACTQPSRVRGMLRLSWRSVLAGLLAAGAALAPGPYLEPLPDRDGCVTQGGAGECRAGRALESVSGWSRAATAGMSMPRSTTAGRWRPLTRRAHGALRQLAGRRGCAGGAPADGCAAARSLAGARAPRLAPTAGASTSRAPAGSRCWRETGAPARCASSRAGAAASPSPDRRGCAAGRAVASALWVAAGPEGRSLYVLGRSDAVAVFRRDPRTGAVRQRGGRRGCVRESRPDLPLLGCEPGRGLGATRAAAITRSGRDPLRRRARRRGDHLPPPPAPRDDRSAAGPARLPGVGRARRMCARPRDARSALADPRSRRARSLRDRLARSRPAVRCRAAASRSTRRLSDPSSRPRRLRERRRQLELRDRARPAGRALARARPERAPRALASEFPTGSLALLARDPRSGRLRQLGGARGCLNATGAEGCGVVPALRGAHLIVPAPGWRHVYVPLVDGDGVLALRVWRGASSPSSAVRDRAAPVQARRGRLGPPSGRLTG